jgi:hypothetical protein
MGWKEREKKREKRVRIVMSLFIAFIMVVSVFGIIIGSTTDEIRYGDYKFTFNGQAYVTKINGEEIPFYSLPNQYGYVNITPEVIGKLEDAFYITTAFDPNTANESLPYIEQVRFDMDQYLPDRTFVGGVLARSEQYASMPIVSCANATQVTPVVVFNVSDKPQVIDVDSCIYFNGRASDFLRLRDALLYEYYGVI